MSNLPAKLDKFKRTRGRPTELTPEVSEIICQMVRLGTTYEVAAIAAGVTRQTFGTWKRRGREEPDSIYADFLSDLEEAEAQGEVVHLHTISKGGAAGAQWILAARHPQRYGQTTKVKLIVDEEIDNFLALMEQELSPEDYAKVAAVAHRHAPS